MKELFNKIKGSKTVILNAAAMGLAIIDQITGYGFVQENAKAIVAIMAGLNTAVRFVTNSPIFTDGKKKA